MAGVGASSLVGWLDCGLAEGLDGLRSFVGISGFVKRTMQRTNLYCR